MKKIAVLFPGQGSQFVGMGQSFYDIDSLFHERFDWLAEMLHVDLKHLCFESNDFLNQTEYTQVAITAVSTLIYQSVAPLLNSADLYLAGHSLGEFAALYASEVFDLETTLRLVRYRGQLMAEAASSNPGQMAAVIGGDQKIIELTCNKLSASGHLLQIANYNLPTQTVISGETEAIRLFSEHKGEVGYNRLVYLPVSGAFHSTMMTDASRIFREKLVLAKRSKPKYPIFMNFNARILDLKEIDSILANQLVSPVRFTDIFANLLQTGVSMFVEIGPGNVLQNFARKIAPELPTISINTPEDIAKLKEIL
ncbi:MAG: ACP S-malonyltransferase [Bacilli bacterium]|nr:ACP S-malonyltransferase [Bacilli bacterium]MBN2696598.1 ACP S-malonyltransferase [Bacilli bacterium]